ncbi:unnamed protein product [Linum trigynum]|uniref:Uncharacterized protein n=1 Tax=Linum trigynum TaxID=586398 RepID=A0AAV2F7E1_9ROSI
MASLRGTWILRPIATYRTTRSRSPNRVGSRHGRQVPNCSLQYLISSDWRFKKYLRVYFYVSPYDCTRSTLREIGKAFDRKWIIGDREECQVRKQDFGNFQVAARMNVIKEARERFGRFCFCFPKGNSVVDVFDRVSTMLAILLL